MTDHNAPISFEPPRSMFGTWLGIVLLFAVFALFVWAVVGAMPRGDRYEENRSKARLEKLKTVQDEANSALNGYAWVDKTKGTVRMPIQRAMEVTMGELAQKKPAPANPIMPADLAQPGMQVTAPVAPAPAPTASPPAGPSVAPATTLVGKDSEARGQAAGSANPPNAAPGTQPGPSATPAASPLAPASRPQPNPSAPMATPVQSSAGTPLPIRGKTP